MPPKSTTPSEHALRAEALLRTLEDIETNVLGITNVEEEDLTGRALIKFESQLANAEANWANFQSLWQERIQLQVLLGDAERFPSDDWKKRYKALQDEIIEAKTILRVAQLACSQEQSFRGAANMTLNASSLAKPQLPRIPIPTFSGDILKWTHFRDTFVSMVHDEPNLSNVERLHYLIGALKGEAAALLSSFTVEDKSYKLAWEKVVKTYDNPRVLASMLVHRIVDCDIRSNKGELQRYDEFLTSVADSVEAFRALKLEKPEEFLLSTLALRALDSETRRHFEMSIKSSRALPTTDDVISFVRDRRTALKMSSSLTSNSPSEANSPSRTSRYPNRRAAKYQQIALHSTSASASKKTLSGRQDEVPQVAQPPRNQRPAASPATRDNPAPKSSQPARCPLCQEAHNLSYCRSFQELPSSRRCELVRTFHVCWNCLRKGHRVTECSSKFRCKDCNRKHHTLIHSEPLTQENTQGDSRGRGEPETFIGFGSAPELTTSKPGSVLLGTVQVIVKGPGGVLCPARAVLDSGSQQTFVSNALASKLKCKVTPFRGSIKGLGEAAVPKTTLKGSIACIIQSLNGSHEYEVSPIVVDRITSVLPSVMVPIEAAGKFLHLPLADHEFANPGPVDLLVGGDLYPQIITGAPYHSDVHGLYLTPTVFGLVISGKLDIHDNTASFSFFTESQVKIETQLKKFWELEEPQPVDRTEPQEQFSEDHFIMTHSRNADGRYVLRLPFKYEVPSDENPADIASRGCAPSRLKDECLWWNGPQWLKLPTSHWYEPTEIVTSMSTFRPVNDKHDFQDDWTKRFSSYRTLIRTIARILRFVKRCQSRDISFAPSINADEFLEAEFRCIKYAQRLYLPKEMLEEPFSTPKSLAHLSPFLDDRGIVRVGGRLHHSSLAPSAKHPSLIPRQSWVARLIITDLHISHFHAGPTLTLSLLRTRFWIQSAGKLIRSCLRSCTQCRIRLAKPVYPQMATLPKGRFNEFRAFIEVGVDYAGPFLIKESRTRKSAIGKAYLCLFVCFATKALHLELVPSLSTAAFLSALERFIARRGTPTTIWSDHGTNFIGASKFLKDIYKFQNNNMDLFTDELAPKGIKWKFIPPRAPHFGGLWEAGVKSVKGLLAGSVGKQPYLHDELATAFTRIEGLLNSRPLCPISEDANNFDFLTPGHFLVGSSLYALPEPSVLNNHPDTTLSRWQALQAQVLLVWNRWRREYLHTLQQRAKWRYKTPDLKVGDLVIMLEKRSLLGQWPVARVAQTFPGRDGTVRSVAVRTPSGNQLTRAVTSLVPLFNPEPVVCSEK